MNRRNKLSLLLPIAACMALAVAPAEAGSANHDWGRTKLEIPGSTNEGNWDGTWVYTSRDYRAALWMRSNEGGLPEYRIHVMRTGPQEQFVTDWQGQATYDVKGAPGKFSLTLDYGDADQLAGRVFWNLEFADSGRTDEGNVAIYRTGDGRYLVLHFRDCERKIRRGAETRSMPFDQIWSFRKVSKRLVTWDELPF